MLRIRFLLIFPNSLKKKRRTHMVKNNFCNTANQRAVSTRKRISCICNYLALFFKQDKMLWTEIPVCIPSNKGQLNIIWHYGMLVTLLIHSYHQNQSFHLCLCLIHQTFHRYLLQWLALLSDGGLHQTPPCQRNHLHSCANGYVVSFTLWKTNIDINLEEQQQQQRQEENEL